MVKTSLKHYAALLTAVGAERLYELWLSRKHSVWAKERGGLEFGRWQLVAMKALQAGLLGGSLLEVVVCKRRARAALVGPMLLGVLSAQVLRYWAVRTLGRRWNIRVIVVPGMDAITDGPYRYMRHPNYLAVIVEGLTLPLVHSAYLTAIGFTVLNAAVLRKRILSEEEALAVHGRYQPLFANKQRFVPTLLRAP